jgi:TP901 family phage tail tape measure protein
VSETSANVGNLVAYLRLQDGTFIADSAKASEALARIGASGEKAAVGVDTAEQAVARVSAATLAATAGLRDTSGALITAADSSSRLQVAQLRLTAASERYNALLLDGTASTARLAGAQASLVASTERYNTVLAQEAAALGAADAALVGTGVAAGEAAVGMSAFRTSVVSAVETLGKLGLLIGAFEAVKVSIDLVKEGAAFQREMLLIQTLAGQSAGQVHALSASVLDMAASLGTAPDALANSLYHIISTGLTGAAALDAMAIAAEGAKVGMASVEDTTNALTSTVASGIPGISSMSQAMGQLTAIVGAGDMKFQDLNEALGSGLLTVVKGYGLSLNDTGAALAVFGDNNIRGANAATMLRMAVQALAVPAKGGTKALESLGISSGQLAKDMQEGGLNKAVTDLHGALNAAGISAEQSGQILTQAFGKRAGPGLEVLLGQFDRFETKVAAVAAGGEEFGRAWEATTQTVAFQFDRLWTEIRVAGIKAFDALQPGIAAAVQWLGTELPKAAGAARDFLAPIGQELGAVLIPALRYTADVLGYVGAALGAVTGFLKENSGAVQIAVVAIGGMWLAWKGYQVVTAAAGIVRAALSAIGERAVYAKAQLEAVATGGSAVSYEVYSARVVAAEKLKEATITASAAAQTAAVDAAAASQAAAWMASAASISASTVETDTALAESAAAAASSAAVASAAANAKATASEQAATRTAAAEAEAALAFKTAAAEETAAAGGMSLAAGAALGVLGVAVTVGTLLWQRHSAAAAADKAAVDGLTAAINEDSGALGVNSQKFVEHALQSAGAYDAAKQLGLSLQTVTQAALGNKDAIAAVNGALDPMIALQKNTGTVTAEMSDKVFKSSYAINQNGDAAKKLQDILGSTNGNIRDARDAYQQLAEANGTVADKTLTTADAAATAAGKAEADAAAKILETNAANDLAYALGTLDKSALSLDQSQTRTQSGLNGLIKAHAAVADQVAKGTLANDDNIGSLSQLTVVGEANRAVIQSRVSDILAESDAMTKNKDSTADVIARVEELSAKLLEQAGAAGFNKDEVQLMIDKLLALPAAAPPPVDITVRTGAAQAAVDALLGSLSQVAVLSAAGAPRGDMYLGASAAPAPAAKAAGGLITGPGTGTSDSVPLMGSNGEFMMQASAVDKYGVNFMSMLNTGSAPISLPPSSGVMQAQASKSGTQGGDPALLREVQELRRTVHQQTDAMAQLTTAQTHALAGASYGSASQLGSSLARQSRAGSSDSGQ